MSILPRLDRFNQRLLKSNEVVERSASLIVIPANRRFGEIKVTVTSGIIAFPKQLLVLLVRIRWNVQTVRCAEARLDSKKSRFFRPDFGEEIFSLMQTHSVDRKGCHHAFANVARQAFRRHWAVLQRRLFIEKLVIELFAKRFDAKIDILLLHDWAVGFFSSKAEAGAVVVTVDRG